MLVSSRVETRMLVPTCGQASVLDMVGWPRGGSGWRGWLDGWMDGV